MPPKKAESTTEISVLEIMQGELIVNILGTSPLIYNAMSEKAWHELLMPSPKKNQAERQASMKHEPFREYVASTYQWRDDDHETRLNFPSAAFKKALASAALDIPGANKSQIGRLVWALGDRVDIYGVPQIFCSITRSADMNRTPDVRTRAILPEWCAQISLRFVKPILKEQTVVNLLAAAGFIQGIGDWRQQKGSGSYGQFKLVSHDDADFVRIMKEGGREAQDEGLKNPRRYDEETTRLLSWFEEEKTRRHGAAATPSLAKANGNGKSKKAASEEAQS